MVLGTADVVLVEEAVGCAGVVVGEVVDESPVPEHEAISVAVRRNAIKSRPMGFRRRCAEPGSRGWFSGSSGAQGKVTVRRRGECTMADTVASALDHLWEIGMDHLSDHVSTVGHPCVDADHRCEDGFDLALWVGVLQAWWVEDRLTLSQHAALAAVPGWTVMMELADWGEPFAELSVR